MENYTKNTRDNSSCLPHDWSVYALVKLNQQSGLKLSHQEPRYGFKKGNIVFTAEPQSGHDSGISSYSQSSECDSSFNIAPQQCEVCCGIRSPMSTRRAQCYTAHFCTNVQSKKNPGTMNVSSQTSPSPSIVFNKETNKKLVKNQKCDKHNKHQARTVHIDVYCTESSSDSDEILGYNSSDTLHEVSDIKINCRRILKKKRILQQSVSKSSCQKSSSCGLSSILDSSSFQNSSFLSTDLDTRQSQIYNDTTSSSDDECSETAWSFNRMNSYKNEILSRRPWFKPENDMKDTGNLSDCSQSPFYRRQNSINNATQVAKIALKFGSAKSPKKDDHHVGPSKNPDCSCFNCRRHFSSRQRSLSMRNETELSDLQKLFRKCL
ncbi:uncharacterized protein LOC126845562 isoform X2 [Adelges cooleyi]|uniref:uncharacterized protein LOC126845562 isoform X2 n=1 Tax=Adelges cooleyi TaxID=133065 RepID=UPI00217FFFCD|nr:uncharacterized protein LOC126845562 isoform X2 [Adelges cooleyi]